MLRLVRLFLCTHRSTVRKTSFDNICTPVRSEFINKTLYELNIGTMVMNSRAYVFGSFTRDVTSPWKFSSHGSGRRLRIALMLTKGPGCVPADRGITLLSNLQRLFYKHVAFA